MSGTTSITVPANRARRALAALVSWSAGTAEVIRREHGRPHTGPADLDLALTLRRPSGPASAVSPRSAEVAGTGRSARRGKRAATRARAAAARR